MFINHHVFHMDIFSDDHVSGYNTVLYDSSGLDLAASSDDGIFHRPLDETSVGDDRRGNYAALKILGGTGIIGSCVDGPFFVKQAEIGRAHV